jgi:antimicrobial peptide system SdpA family protein
MALLATIGLILSISLPFNPISRYFSGDYFVKSLVPEGWAFFTRSPREERLDIYYLKRDGWVPNPLAPRGAPANMFGLMRKLRAQSVELAILLSQVRQEQWIELNKGFASANINSSASLRVINPSPFPVMEGTIAVVKHKPVPWSYAALITTDLLPCQYVVLTVACSKTRDSKH